MVRIPSGRTTARPCSALLWFPSRAFVHPHRAFNSGLDGAPVGLVALPAAGISNKGVPAEGLQFPCNDPSTSPGSTGPLQISDISSLFQLWGGGTTVIHHWERVVERNEQCAQIFIQGYCSCRLKHEFTVIFFKLDIGIRTIVLILIIVTTLWVLQLFLQQCVLCQCFPLPPLFFANEIISWFKLFFITRRKHGDLWRAALRTTCSMCQNCKGSKQQARGNGDVFWLLWL